MSRWKKAPRRARIPRYPLFAGLSIQASWEPHYFLSLNLLDNQRGLNMSTLLEQDRVRFRTPELYREDIRAEGKVSILRRQSLSSVARWRESFADLRKDSRYYEIVEDTICDEFEYRYFAITDSCGRICAVQPFFILNQDLLAGAGPRIKAALSRIRGFWPRFLVVRTLMVGCAAGEAHLRAIEEPESGRAAKLLARNIVRLAREEKAPVVRGKALDLVLRLTRAPRGDAGDARGGSLPL